MNTTNSKECCKPVLAAIHADDCVISNGMRFLLSDLRDFHRACDIPIHEKPVIPLAERVKLREDLLTEEYEEYMRASAADDLVEIADALADIIYICVGTALEYGIPLDRVWAEVHRSNMAKANGPRRADGKIMKPANWTPPDVAGILGIVTS